MVLQRERTVPIWGTAAANEAVTVTFNGQVKSAKASSGGSWKINLDVMTAGGPYTMTIVGSNTVTLTDVMVGEVWHCAGQSNMDTRMNYWEYPNLADSIATANYPLLRYITMRQPGQTIQWQNVTPATVGSLSAAGYFFGRELLSHWNGVAVGLMVSAVGGTIIEQWLDPATKAADAALASDTAIGTQYNQWVKPIVGYGVRGTVWLQGENNTSSALYKVYGDRLQKMIPGWRKAWGQLDMPFLVAGLCHKGGIQTVAGETSNEASIRELQRQVTDTLAMSWLAVLVDLGDDATWHYPQKPEAGRRIGALARGAVYGQTGFTYQSPRPLGCFWRGTTIVIPFDARGSHLKLTAGTNPTGFAVAGANNAWSWASTATLKGDTILLTTTITNPTQVEFAWANQPIMNLGSVAGLPASPFKMFIGANSSSSVAVSSSSGVALSSSSSVTVLSSGGLSSSTVLSSSSTAVSSSSENATTVGKVLSNNQVQTRYTDGVLYVNGLHGPAVVRILSVKGTILASYRVWSDGPVVVGFWPSNKIIIEVINP